MPPILAAANEEGLDADMAGLGGKREDVGIADACRVDRLTALNEGQRLQTIPQDGCAVGKVSAQTPIRLAILVLRSASRFSVT